LTSQRAIGEAVNLRPAVQRRIKRMGRPAVIKATSLSLIRRASPSDYHPGEVHVESERIDPARRHKNRLAGTRSAAMLLRLPAMRTLSFVITVPTMTATKRSLAALF